MTTAEAGVEIEQVHGVLKEFDRVEAGIAYLREKHSRVIYDVSTVAGLEAAKDARAEIRAPRYGVEQVRKAAKAPLLALGRTIDAEAARITTALLEIEKPIDDQIKAEEDRREKEREKKREAEREKLRQEAAARLKADEEALAAERAKLAEAQAALAAEGEAARAEAAKVREAQETEARRLAAIQAEVDAKNRAAEEAAAAEARRKADEARRRERPESGGNRQGGGGLLRGRQRDGRGVAHIPL